MTDAVRPAPDALREAPRPSPSPAPTALASADLLRGGKMVEIRHNGEVYRLQATRLGKLILTK